MQDGVVCRPWRVLLQLLFGRGATSNMATEAQTCVHMLRICTCVLTEHNYGSGSSCVPMSSHSLKPHVFPAHPDIDAKSRWSIRDLWWLLVALKPCLVELHSGQCWRCVLQYEACCCCFGRVLLFLCRLAHMMHTYIHVTSFKRWCHINEIYNVSLKVWVQLINTSLFRCTYTNTHAEVVMHKEQPSGQTKAWWNINHVMLNHMSYFVSSHLLIDFISLIKSWNF